MGDKIMNSKNILYILGACLFSSFLSINAEASAITPELKNNREKVIQACEASYAKVKKKGEELRKMKKPGLLSSSKEKERYKKLNLNIKVFDDQFAEFARFTNEKISLRTINDPEKLRDQLNAYSSNCKRFSDGLLGFVDWAMGKETSQNKGFENTYKIWQEDAK